jgi:glycosyltransferase involved in cell wall biosynthesis
MTKVDYIAICDPVSVQELGHNLAALSRYSKYLSNQCSHLDIFAGSSLSKCNIDRSEFEGDLIYHYSHYYSRVINVPSSRLDRMGADLLELDKPEAHETAKKAAIEELRKILSIAGQHEKAIVYFPSVDYYSLLALSCLHETIKQSQTKVLIRFIGVMENVSYHPKEGETLDSLLRHLSQASYGNINCPYNVSAESPVLAKKLRDLYGLDVTITPTLIDEEQLNPASNEIFTFSFPGSARMDKGFDRILRILNEIDKSHPSLDYRVYLQSLPSSEVIHHYNIQRELFKHPRVRVYPATVSQEELRNYIQESHVLVLPYCSRIYEERSSAMMAEAACYGRQVVASSSCGFSQQIEDLGIGITCDNEAEMGKAIAKYALIDGKALESMTKTARINYKDHAAESYGKFFAFSS